MLVKYLRNENRIPYGCVVAVGPGMVGYSVCNPKDKFNKELGRQIAIGRANHDLTDYLSIRNRVPHSLIPVVLDEVVEMDKRSVKYFKE